MNCLHLIISQEILPILSVSENSWRMNLMEGGLGGRSDSVLIRRQCPTLNPTFPRLYVMCKTWYTANWILHPDIELNIYGWGTRRTTASDILTTDHGDARNFQGLKSWPMQMFWKQPLSEQHSPSHLLSYFDKWWPTGVDERCHHLMSQCHNVIISSSDDDQQLLMCCVTISCLM